MNDDESDGNSEVPTVLSDGTVPFGEENSLARYDAARELADQIGVDGTFPFEEEQIVTQRNYLRRLGSGGMGVVWLVESTPCDSDGTPTGVGGLSAVKEVRKDAIGTNVDAYMAALLSEAQILRGFNHPNIVCLHEVRELSDAVRLTIEFVDGMDCSSLVQYHDSRNLAMPYQLAGVVGLYAARALRETHNHDPSILHRDIKPGNILLGFNTQIKVTDFGIAGVISDDPQEAGKIMGTPDYIAPELVKKQGLTHLSDLYSLGVTLYQMVTGKSPYNLRETLDKSKRGTTTVKDVITLLEKMQTVGIRPVHEVVQGVPEEFSGIIDKLMAIDPSQRYQSALEFETDLYKSLYPSLTVREAMALVGSSKTDLEKKIGGYGASAKGVSILVRACDQTSLVEEPSNELLSPDLLGDVYAHMKFLEDTSGSFELFRPRKYTDEAQEIIGLEGNPCLKEQVV